eukprot:gene16965-23297_t
MNVINPIQADLFMPIQLPLKLYENIEYQGVFTNPVMSKNSVIKKRKIPWNNKNCGGISVHCSDINCIIINQEKTERKCVCATTSQYSNHFNYDLHFQLAKYCLRYKLVGEKNKLKWEIAISMMFNSSKFHSFSPISIKSIKQRFFGLMLSEFESRNPIETNIQNYDRFGNFFHPNFIKRSFTPYDRLLFKLWKLSKQHHYTSERFFHVLDFSKGNIIIDTNNKYWDTDSVSDMTNDSFIDNIDDEYEFDGVSEVRIDEEIPSPPGHFDTSICSTANSYSDYSPFESYTYNHKRLASEMLNNRQDKIYSLDVLEEDMMLGQSKLQNQSLSPTPTINQLNNEAIYANINSFGWFMSNFEDMVAYEEIRKGESRVSDGEVKTDKETD